MAINKLSKYHIIVEDLREGIKKGILKEGDMLPSENQLSSAYETSRVTARKALSVLIAQGYIFAVQGKGNFVSKAKTDEFVLKTGGRDENEKRLIGAQIIKPTKRLTEIMQLNRADKIIETKSFFMRENQTVGYSIKYIRYDAKRPVMEKELHYINSDEQSTENSVVICVCNANEDISGILKIPIGYPMMHIQKKISDSTHRLVGLEDIYMMGERHRIVGE